MQDEERREAWAAFALLFGVVASHAVLETARDALFLAAIPVTRLPWVFIGTAVMSLAAMKLQRRVTRELAEWRALFTWLLLAGALVMAFVLLHGALGNAGLYALYMISGVLMTVMLAHFWTLLGALFSVTQAKRLYAFIGAGGALGAITGSAASATLSELVTPDRLLIVAAGGFWLSAAGVTVLRTAAGPEPEPEPEPGSTLTKGLGYIVQRPYAVRVVLFMLLSAACLTLVDYVFKRREAGCSRFQSGVTL